MEITVDTSAIMAVLLNEPSKERLREQTRGVELVSAPTLPWEVGNGLSALFKRKRLDRNQAAIALMSFRQIPCAWERSRSRPPFAWRRSRTSAPTMPASSSVRGSTEPPSFRWTVRRCGSPGGWVSRSWRYEP
jgi:hypothetical protein